MKVLVVDDEPLARERLSSLLAKCGMVATITEADSADRALAMIRRDEPDAIFLDISMPGRSGLSMALEESGLPPVVFVTAHPQFGAKAFDADATDYLLKPVSRERLAQSLAKIKRGSNSLEHLGLTAVSEQRVIATVRGENYFFDPADITRFFISQRYSVFRVGNREYLIEETLSSLERRLCCQGFFRLHRHELINVHAIKAIRREPGRDGEQVHLSDEQVACGSRRRIRKLRKYMSTLSEPQVQEYGTAPMPYARR
jgi:DNA-binding LytR/AlgR family response regulator